MDGKREKTIDGHLVCAVWHSYMNQMGIMGSRVDGHGDAGWGMGRFEKSTFHLAKSRKTSDSDVLMNKILTELK